MRIALSLTLAALIGSFVPAQAELSKKPNIVVIWGDDIGQSNISAYTNGLMGYRTPNIDSHRQRGDDLHRLLRRAELHRGPLGLHHRPKRVSHRSEQGRPARAPISACARKTRPSPSCSKPQGYATGQFGKNHLGDKDELLPTAHGFDEFYGNLYHLNAEEEPELPDYPKANDPEFPEFPQEFRAARRDPQLRAMAGRNADDRGYRPADQEADGDHRRRHRRRAGGFHRQAGQGGQARFLSG